MYIGQGNIRSRLLAHLAKIQQVRPRQQAAFSGDLQASWAEVPGVTSQQLLEVECDLIAGHVLSMGTAPLA